MTTSRTVTSPQTGAIIPVTSISEKLNVKPLIHMGKVVTNGLGEVVMDDQWIYVHVIGYGRKAINVNRANYCQKMYMSEVTIQQSVGNKKMDAELKKFIDQVSDKIVFKKFGKWYRIFLDKKTTQTYGIDKVVRYNWTVNPNMMFDGMNASELSVDWKRKFYVR